MSLWVVYLDVLDVVYLAMAASVLCIMYTMVFQLIQRGIGLTSWMAEFLVLIERAN